MVATLDRASTFAVLIGCEYGVFYVVRSDVPGLNIEADTLEEFERAAKEITPELLGVDHDVTMRFQMAPKEA